MRIEHVAIWVRDLEGMKSFYEKYFDAQAGELYHNPTRQFSSYFLSFKEGCRLELMHQPDIRESYADKTIGITHIAIALGTKQHVDLLTEQLRQDGHTVLGEPRTTGDGYYESVILDPEKNRIELTV